MILKDGVDVGGSGVKKEVGKWNRLEGPPLGGRGQPSVQGVNPYCRRSHQQQPQDLQQNCASSHIRLFTPSARPLESSSTTRAVTNTTFSHHLLQNSPAVLRESSDPRRVPLTPSEAKPVPSTASSQPLLLDSSSAPFSLQDCPAAITPQDSPAVLQEGCTSHIRLFPPSARPLESSPVIKPVTDTSLSQPLLDPPTVLRQSPNSQTRLFTSSATEAQTAASQEILQDSPAVLQEIRPSHIQLFSPSGRALDPAVSESSQPTLLDSSAVPPLPSDSKPVTSTPSSQHFFQDPSPTLLQEGSNSHVLLYSPSAEPPLSTPPSQPRPRDPEVSRIGLFTPSDTSAASTPASSQRPLPAAPQENSKSDIRQPEESFSAPTSTTSAYGLYTPTATRAVTSPESSRQLLEDSSAILPENSFDPQRRQFDLSSEVKPVASTASSQPLLIDSSGFSPNSHTGNFAHTATKAVTSRESLQLVQDSPAVLQDTPNSHISLFNSSGRPVESCSVTEPITSRQIVQDPSTVLQRSPNFPITLFTPSGQPAESVLGSSPPPVIGSPLPVPSALIGLPPKSSPSNLVQQSLGGVSASGPVYFTPPPPSTVGQSTNVLTPTVVSSSSSFSHLFGPPSLDSPPKGPLSEAGGTLEPTPFPPGVSPLPFVGVSAAPPSPIVGVPPLPPSSASLPGTGQPAPPSLISPPKGGGGGSSYRAVSLKRRVYAAPPDLKVCPRMGGGDEIGRPGVGPRVSVELPSTIQENPATTPPPAPVFMQTVQGLVYRPVYHHWFYRKGSSESTAWEPFSMADSLNLEQAFNSDGVDGETTVATDGGRYDVEVASRRRVAVYWEEDPGEVRRCSWFVRSPGNSRFTPYDENIAALLEDEYKKAATSNDWNRKVELADGEVIILHGPSAIAHHQRSSSPDPWGNPPTMQFKPRLVKRGLDEFDIPEGEPSQVDHLLLVVHGIGKACDLRFRSLVQVVDDLRGVSLGLVQSHFKGGCERGTVGRVEMLPVEWHRALHTEAIDQRLSDITLPSIPRARQFTNETLLDILFYTSPVFCERIVQAVGAELNRVYSLYLERNPGFKGGVSLGGHSLGSLILFDMLCHQRPPRSPKPHQDPSLGHDQEEADDDMPEPGHLGCLKAKARLSRRMSYLTIGSAGTGQPYIMYPQLTFQPTAFFALGSPIGMFVTVRGIEVLGEDFRFPTCPRFFNIFHPNDPVAYRIEGLICPELASIPAMLIPHHKGRKRMHLELKDTMAHVTAALKQKIVESVRNTWNTVYQLAMFQKPHQAIESAVDKVLADEMMCSGGEGGEEGSEEEGAGEEVRVGCLNGGRRIDYVLQEAPLETFNQYISAVRSHVVYWESEDTTLMILKEIYATMGVSADSQVQQSVLPFDLSNEDYMDSRYSPCTSEPF